jgi:hypothetical protein
MAVGRIVLRLWVLAIVVIAIGAAIDGGGPLVAAWFQGEDVGTKLRRECEAISREAVEPYYSDERRERFVRE